MRHPLPLLLFAFVISTAAAEESRPVKLFTEKGEPKGFKVVQWNEVSKPAAEDMMWTVDDQGILHGSKKGGTWLISDAEYGDFELELEFKLPPTGNSGVALRVPLHGDPAYDGMELQIVDPRYYNNKGEAEQLCGAIYRAIAPAKKVFKPEDWNKYQITCQGPHVKVVLNGEVIQDFNLDEQTKALHRDNPKVASPPLKDRPRRGHIGFQNLSKEGHVQIRNVTLRVLDGEKNAK
jgi:hypothetical protein